MKFLEKYQSIVEEAIKEYKFEEDPVELYDPMNYIMNLGGKRLRPIILLMACDLFEGDLKKALKPALAIEYFHNFSLMHDDIMDQASLRRNKETVHIKYNKNTAILSGDALLVKSFQMFEDLEDNLFKECSKLFSQTALQVCEGQQYDMNFEEQQEVSYEEYIKMITGKTAVLCACALKTGAILAKATKQDAHNIYDFGKLLGIAFQLKDDYLDIFGKEEVVGKKHGGDIYENKKTILYLLAMQRGSEEQKKELLSWFAVREENSEKIQAVVKVFKDLKVDIACMELIDKYNQKAQKCLSEINVSEDKKKPFYELVEYLLLREN